MRAVRRRVPSAGSVAGKTDWSTALLCLLAVAGFAANSLLARAALGTAVIDPATYTGIRLASGTVMLGVLAPPLPRRRGATPMLASNRPRPAWAAPAALAIYAAAFSYSYVRIGAALGALILFPTVKVALLVQGHRRGERHRPIAWAGAALGLAGLFVLTAPGVDRPDLLGVVLMVTAGLAWAVYTVAGQQVTDAVGSTRDNFAGATLLVVPLVLLTGGDVTTARGLLLACLSGAVTSALAYVVWYRVVGRLSGLQLGLAQLAVPVLASVGAVLILGETFTPRLAVGALLIVTGIALAVTVPRR